MPKRKLQRESYLVNHVKSVKISNMHLWFSSIRSIPVYHGGVERDSCLLPNYYPKNWVVISPRLPSRHIHHYLISSITTSFSSFCHISSSQLTTPFPSVCQLSTIVLKSTCDMVKFGLRSYFYFLNLHKLNQHKNIKKSSSAWHSISCSIVIRIISEWHTN